MTTLIKRNTTVPTKAALPVVVEATRLASVKMSSTWIMHAVGFMTTSVSPYRFTKVCTHFPDSPARVLVNQDASSKLKTTSLVFLSVGMAFSVATSNETLLSV